MWRALNADRGGEARIADEHDGPWNADFGKKRFGGTEQVQCGFGEGGECSRAGATGIRRTSAGSCGSWADGRAEGWFGFFDKVSKKWREFAGYQALTAVN